MGILAAVANYFARRAEPLIRAAIVRALEHRFNARVELDSFHIVLRDGLSAQGNGLRIWPADSAAAPPPKPDPGNPLGAQPQLPVPANQPLIKLAEFRFHAPFRLRLGQTVNISVVELKGLDIVLPPHARFANPSSPLTNAPPARSSADSKSIGLNSIVDFNVHTIECTGGSLTLDTTKPGKLPFFIAFSRFKVDYSGADKPLAFEADLVNPKPHGNIHTIGSFGPWSSADPGESAVSGTYHFTNADLADFKGIAGILDSTGRYQGNLRSVSAEGDANVPDFRLTHFETRVPLRVHYRAQVDTTNGDTQLDNVDAVLGSSRFKASGQVVRVQSELPAPGAASPPTGHQIDLNIDIRQIPIADFLRLTSQNEQPVLTGDITTLSVLNIHPGPEPVIERIHLKGNFNLAGAHFSNPKIQDRVDELSFRGQGRPADLRQSGSADVNSTMTGNYEMASAKINLPNLVYTVPGSEIDLAGTYAVESGGLDFTGNAKMQATVSQMVGGWKGLLLKPVDPFFRKKGAGTLVPIRITGTRSHPDFRLDFGGPKKTSP